VQEKVRDFGYPMYLNTIGGRFAIDGCSSTRTRWVLRLRDAFFIQFVPPSCSQSFGFRFWCFVFSYDPSRVWSDFYPLIISSIHDILLFITLSFSIIIALFYDVIILLNDLILLTLDCTSVSFDG